MKMIKGLTKKEYFMAYREANKDKIAVKIKAYREANKDKIAVKIKAYYEANKDKIAVKSKVYREANKDKIAVKIKAYYEANKDKIKAYREANKDKIKAYREANKDKIKAYYEANKDKIKAYREANKDKIKAYFRNNYINLPVFGGKGKPRMYTNGITKQAKEALPKIINKVLEDCIKNPKKYLDDDYSETMICKCGHDWNFHNVLDNEVCHEMTCDCKKFVRKQNENPKYRR